MVRVGVAGVSCVAVAVGCGWFNFPEVSVVLRGTGGCRFRAAKVSAFAGQRTSESERRVFCEYVCDVCPTFILCSFFVVFVPSLYVYIEFIDSLDVAVRQK